MISKYFNPYTDVGFKKLFGEEGSKDLLRITGVGIKLNQQEKGQTPYLMHIFALMMRILRQGSLRQ